MPALLSHAMVVRRSREEWKIRGNVFDAFTERVIHQLSSQGLFGDLKSALALGKEANIFIASPGRGQREHVIVKIYRTENCNFKRMYDYLREDPRYMQVKAQKRAVVFAWAQREYRNLLLARDAIPVPTPLAVKQNVLVMRLVGDPETGSVARALKDVYPDEPEAFARETLNHVATLWKHGLVHGDLSAFNILNDGHPVFIDFSQASPARSESGPHYLRRDLTNLSTFFAKLDVSVDVDAEERRIRQEF